ncbi:MAG: RodZ domain-containing protein [Candidatus Omnitrophota bacterium]
MGNAGERLKKIRLEKGLSLEEAQKKTKVHLNILKAIEGDTITNLNPIYLKGFLKIYCKFLGVDPKDCVADYKEARCEAANIPLGKEDAKFEKKSGVLRETAIKLGTFKPSKKIKTATVIILGIVIFSIGLFNLGKFISLKSSRNNLMKERLAAMSAAVERKKEKPKAKTVSPSPNQQAVQHLTQKAQPTEITLVMSAKEKCYAVVKVDGRVAFQRTLERGRSENWRAKEKIELSVGNAGAVELIVNGTRFPNIGKRNEPRKNILITKEGLNIGR